MQIRRSRGWPLVALITALWSLLAAPLATAQTGPVQYGYDRLGRLTTVVDGSGNVAIYNYDAVGNLVSIQRIDAPPDPVAITALAPAEGKVGSTVSVLGKGFSPTAGQNLVSFTGGAAATVTTASSTGLRVTVPAGATTGPITVTAPAGTAISPMSFRVIGPITVTPSGAYILPGTTQQFAAATSTGGAPSVDWIVNGVLGGNALVGTISPTGLYSAPATYVQQSVPLTISARDQADPTTVGSTAATLGVLGTLRFAASRELSVTMPGPLVSINSFQTSVSTVIGGHAAATVQTSVSAVIGGNPAATVAGAPIVAIFGPWISGVSPTTGTHGTTVSVTLTGVGFTGATGVTVLRSNVSDSTITASLVGVSDDGTQATLQLVLASNAPTGVRVLEITVPTRTSTPVGLTGLNLFTVQ